MNDALIIENNVLKSKLGKRNTIIKHLRPQVKRLESNQNEIIELILRYGLIDGDHHKQWILDQILRICSGSEYQKNLDSYNLIGEWDEGIPP